MCPSSRHSRKEQQVALIARFIVLWDTPSDPEAFDKHYREVHIPLCRQLPGLRRYTLSRNPTPIVGERIDAEVDWDLEIGAAIISRLATDPVFLTSTGGYFDRRAARLLCPAPGRAEARQREHAGGFLAAPVGGEDLAVEDQMSEFVVAGMLDGFVSTEPGTVQVEPSTVVIGVAFPRDPMSSFARASARGRRHPAPWRSLGRWWPPFRMLRPRRGISPVAILGAGRGRTRR
ncbi:hypothetical protein ABIA39_001790 [Nocardia sp. GAS34]